MAKATSLTLPKTLIPVLDEAAADKGLSRSAYVTQTLAGHLGFNLSDDSSALPTGAITR